MYPWDIGMGMSSTPIERVMKMECSSIAGMPYGEDPVEWSKKVREQNKVFEQLRVKAEEEAYDGTDAGN